jgi:hypothetical protein
LQIEAVQSQLFALRIVKRDRSRVVRNDSAQRIAGRAEKATQSQVGDYGIIDVEQQLVSVTIGFGARKESFILPISTNSGRRPWMIAHTGIIS